MEKTLLMFPLLILTFFSVSCNCESLYTHYYRESCPLAEEIVRQNVASVLYTDPLMAAALLRLHFHDCFVLGCDASVLLDDTLDIVSEKQATPNKNSLRGFEVIDQIKAALEEACPLTVSCADILALAARDAVELRGGPGWEVELGRRDSLEASFSGANQFIPAPNFTLEQLIANFHSHGLDIQDLVALSGGHTIGRSRCLSFRSRIYNPQTYEEQKYYDRSYVFRRTLSSICPESGRDNGLAPLDFKTSRRFDNQYYHNILEGRGLLESDGALVSEDPDGDAVRLVWAYALSQPLFFRDFVNSIIKMGSISVLTGDGGEIRRNCRFINL
ncbi:putative peroxidase [Dioscorea sansibarensis]